MNGEAVNWSFLVKGPLRTSNRWDPELMIIILGICARGLFIASATGAACKGGEYCLQQKVERASGLLPLE